MCIKHMDCVEMRPVHCTLMRAYRMVWVRVSQPCTRSPAIAEGPRDAGVPVEIW